MTERYTLREPLIVTYSGPSGDREEATTQLQIRKPVAGDLRMLDQHKGEIAKSLAMIGQLTGLSIIEVDKLSVADVAGIGAVIEGFMPPGLPTGLTA